jgi:hypothetical protein
VEYYKVLYSRESMQFFKGEDMLAITLEYRLEWEEYGRPKIF